MFRSIASLATCKPKQLITHQTNVHKSPPDQCMPELDRTPILEKRRSVTHLLVAERTLPSDLRLAVLHPRLIVRPRRQSLPYITFDCKIIVSHFSIENHHS